MTAWLRVEAPSLRYSDLACDLMVWRDRNSSSPISANGRWVGSIGSRRSSAPVSAEALGCAVPDVATALGYDVAAALEEPGDR